MMQMHIVAIKYRAKHGDKHNSFSDMTEIAVLTYFLEHFAIPLNFCLWWGGVLILTLKHIKGRKRINNIN